MPSPLRTAVPLAIAAAVLALFAGTLWFLWQKSRPRPETFETAKPQVTDIVKKVVASGAIQPRKEIEIKPKVPGILKKLHVEAGQMVARGDLIAEIQIIPDAVNLNEAELRLRSARLHNDQVARELERAEALGRRGAAAQTELDRLRADHKQSVEEVRAAESRVRLLREGALGRAKGGSTQVEATVTGTVLQVLVREGSSVINANSFNPGTTIVSLADMSDMIFKGKIDESDVGKLAEGMPAEIVVGALEDARFAGRLTHIAPKSLVKEGATEFELEAAFRADGGPGSPQARLRAGYSANANLVLDRKLKVLAIPEEVVTFEGARRFVEVQTAPGMFQRREVKLGLSDGLMTEVLSGVGPDDALKKPARAAAPGR
jgi:HlyD family secretion protein